MYYFKFIIFTLLLNLIYATVEIYPASQISYSGDDIVIYCNSTNNYRLSWALNTNNHYDVYNNRKDYKLINTFLFDKIFIDDERFNISQTGGISKLTIHNANINDEGSYMCRCESTFSRWEESFVKISQVKKYLINETVNNDSINSGVTVTFNETNSNRILSYNMINVNSTILFNNVNNNTIITDNCVNINSTIVYNLTNTNVDFTDKTININSFIVYLNLDENTLFTNGSLNINTTIILLNT